MLAGLLCALVLVVALWVVRTERVASVGSLGDAWVGHRNPRWIVAGACAVLAAGAPVVLMSPWVSGEPTFWGDDATHARVAADIAAQGIPHGWIDSYMGGFPFGIHYPPVGWLLIALLLKMGFTPAGATHLLGAVATLAAPLSFYAGAVRCGARPAFAVVGAVCLSWVAPYNPFVGGYESFFSLGLVSQVLALPLCILLASSLARSSGSWPPVLLGASAMAVHPQLTAATLVVAFAACAVAGRRAPIERCVRAAIAAGATAAALYGPGLVTLEIPFGWPPDMGWKRVGFRPSRLIWWLQDGDLLDAGRVMALTQLLGGCGLALVLQARRPVPRAVAVGCVLSLLLSVSGGALEQSGVVGAAMLAFLQPLRVVALTPVVAAAMVTVALEESSARISRAFCVTQGPVWAASVGPALTGIVGIILLFALPNRWQYAKDRRLDLKTRASQPCSALAPHGYDRATVHGWVRSLSRGRLWSSQHSEDPLYACVINDGIELSSSVPMATTGGAGSHVGVHWIAFSRLEPTRIGSVDRAEALGVRHVLLLHDGEPPAGWKRAQRSGNIQLWSHERATSLVGVGCIRERWRGSDSALRKQVQDGMATPEGADALMSPTRFIALEAAEVPFEKREEASIGCDPNLATVREVPREPGALEAEVRCASPVDVILRMAAFPTWRVTVNGEPSSVVERVSPGFLSVRVPAGEHRILAVAQWPRGYLGLLVLGALGVLLAGSVQLAWVRRLTGAKFGHFG